MENVYVKRDLKNNYGLQIRSFCNVADCMVRYLYYTLKKTRYLQGKKSFVKSNH